MVDYKRILQLRAEGVSQRGIADALGCSRNTVAGAFTAADSAGVGFGQVADLGADEVRHLLLPEPVRPDSGRAVECSRKNGDVVYAASSWMCLNPSSYSCGVK